jgi:outer membrane biosynthesis protein TonB
MKSSYILRAGLLLPLLVAGCAHKQKAAVNQPALAPPIEDTPPPSPNKAPTNLPPPVITVPTPAQPKAANTPPPAPAPKPKPHHKPKPAQGDTGTPVAANTPAPAVSAVGNLSTGEPADLRKQTDNTISETERGLNGISRQLNDQEKKTSVQIREFLKQARAAMTTGDVDGAHTLAQKAKVLLGELTQ